MPENEHTDIPFQFETERLLMRSPRTGDGVYVHTAVVESLPELRAFPASLPWAMEAPSLDISEQYCRQGEASYRALTSLPMLLFLKGTDTLIGSSGVHEFIWSLAQCEIGYWGRTRFSGQGLITEAVKAITAFAFNDLSIQRIVALPDDANLRSCLVCERAGYALEKTIEHERSDPDGTMRNTRVYAKYR